MSQKCERSSHYDCGQRLTKPGQLAYLYLWGGKYLGHRVHAWEVMWIDHVATQACFAWLSSSARMTRFHTNLHIGSMKILSMWMVVPVTSWGTNRLELDCGPVNLETTWHIAGQLLESPSFQSCPPVGLSSNTCNNVALHGDVTVLMKFTAIPI